MGMDWLPCNIAFNDFNGWVLDTGKKSINLKTFCLRFKTPGTFLCEKKNQLLKTS